LLGDPNFANEVEGPPAEAGSPERWGMLSLADWQLRELLDFIRPSNIALAGLIRVVGAPSEGRSCSVSEPLLGRSALVYDHAAIDCEMFGPCVAAWIEKASLLAG
jgi:hypothetical protein